MTINEAYEILNSVKESPMFGEQKKRLDDTAETIEGIIKDIESAHEQQEKKRRRATANGRQEGTKNRRPSIKSPNEYQISKEFEKHLKNLSRLDSPKQWSENIAKDVGIELDRSKEYIEIEKCTMQTDVFVEELRQHVCDDIAEVTLDGESKQWIATVVGGIIEFFALVFYGLCAFDVGPFNHSLINDALAGFIGELGPVLVIVIVPIICAFINRKNIREYDKHHAIKYSELVCSSKERGSFKKSIMLMSFGEEFEEIRQRDRKFYEIANKILEIGQDVKKSDQEMNAKLDLILQNLFEGKVRAKDADEWANRNSKDITAEQNLKLRWQIYCSALRNEYDDICCNKRGCWFSKDVHKYRDDFLSATRKCGVNISEDSMRALESRITNVLKPDTNLAKQEADRILNEFLWKIHCEDDKFQNVLGAYVGDLRSGYDDICRNKLERFRNQEYREGLLTVADKVGAKIRREDLLGLQQRIICVLRPESEQAKQQADKMLDEFINNYIQTKE